MSGSAHSSSSDDMQQQESIPSDSAAVGPDEPPVHLETIHETNELEV